MLERWARLSLLSHRNEQVLHNSITVHAVVAGGCYVVGNIIVSLELNDAAF